jgi:hypothetical protein
VRLWPSLHWLAQVSIRVLCLYAVRCFPLFNCSGASRQGQARHRVCGRRKGEHIMARLPCQEVLLDFSHCAHTMAGEGCCENDVASGVPTNT